MHVLWRWWETGKKKRQVLNAVKLCNQLSLENDVCASQSTKTSRCARFLTNTFMSFSKKRKKRCELLITKQGRYNEKKGRKRNVKVKIHSTSNECPSLFFFLLLLLSF